MSTGLFSLVADYEELVNSLLWHLEHAPRPRLVMQALRQDAAQLRQEAIDCGVAVDDES